MYCSLKMRVNFCCCFYINTTTSAAAALTTATAAVTTTTITTTTTTTLYCMLLNSGAWHAAIIWDDYLGLLKTKPNVFCIWNQSVSRCKHFPPRL